MSDYLKAFLVAAAITILLTPLAIRIAPKIGAMDIPKDNRRMHKEPLPRFGGTPLFIAIMATFLIFLDVDNQVRGLLIGSCLIYALGLIDDFVDLNPWIKLCGQILSALVLWFNTIQINGMANFLPFGPEYIVFPNWLSICITVFWIVGISNAINLIDGLDGLAAGITCIACIVVSYTAAYTGRSETSVMMLAVAGATFGFLFFNFNPAKIIMGDSGALLLGYLLASVSLYGVAPTKSTTLFSVIIPIFILALPIFDTSFAIVRRAVNHRPIMEGDKSHLHHKIVALGIGVRRAVITLYSISAIMGVAGILWTMKLKWEALILAFIAGTLVMTFLGIELPKKRRDELSGNEAVAEASAEPGTEGAAAEESQAEQETAEPQITETTEKSE